MFELNYKITEDDIKKINFSIMIAYFIPYLLVSLLGLGAGIAAVVLRPTQVLFVLGIVLLVLGAILFGCAILLLIVPKNFITSALVPSSETERNLKVDDNGMIVTTENREPVEIPFYAVSRVKVKLDRMLVYLGRDRVLVVKDAMVIGSFEELCAFVKSRAGLGAPSVSAIQNMPSAENEEFNNAVDENANSAETNQTTASPIAEPSQVESADVAENAESAVDTDNTADTAADAESAEKGRVDAETAAVADIEEKSDTTVGDEDAAPVEKTVATKSTAAKSGAKSTTAKTTGAKSTTAKSGTKSAATKSGAKSTTATPAAKKTGTKTAAAKATVKAKTEDSEKSEH